MKLAFSMGEYGAINEKDRFLITDGVSCSTCSGATLLFKWEAVNIKQHDIYGVALENPLEYVNKINIRNKFFLQRVSNTVHIWWKGKGVSISLSEVSLGLSANLKYGIKIDYDTFLRRLVLGR